MSKNKILWVDEDQHHWEAERDALSDFNYELLPIKNANKALKFLSQNPDWSDIKLIILDVMLLAGERSANSQEPYIPPTNYAGLVLARCLYDINKKVGRKILFFSCASDSQHIADINSCAAEIGAKYLPKSDEFRCLDFALKLRELKLI